MFCSNCGQKCVGEAKFCMYCGTQVLQDKPTGRPGNMSMWQAFKSFDKDGSGTLTADEVVGILTSTRGGAPMSASEARMFVAYFDTNGDGVLDANEFCAAMGQPIIMNGNELGSWNVPSGAIAPSAPAGTYMGGDEVLMATPVADMASNVVTNNTTHHTAHNISGNSGTVNIVAGNQDNSKVITTNISVQATKSSEQLAMEAKIAEEERRMIRLRMEEEVRREMQERADAEAARKRSSATKKVAFGATVGFFCAGPLGAAIGAKLGSDHAAKLRERGAL